MISACEQNGVKLASIFNNRYREGNIFVRNAILNGRLGKLINVNVYNRWYRAPEYYSQSPWKGTWAFDGGGALMNQGIHNIDLLLWFIGGIESVFAYTGTLVHRSIETEDTAVVVFKSKSCVLGTLVVGTSIYPGFASRIEITGDRGSLSVSDGTIDFWSFKDRDEMDEQASIYMTKEVDNKRVSDPLSFDYTYHKKQLEQIIWAFQNNREAEVNGKEARKLLH